MTEELLLAPEAPAPIVLPAGAGVVSWRQDGLVFRQKIFSIAKKIHIYDSQGKLVYFVKQKAFRLREDIRIYGDEAMSEEKLIIRTRKMLDFNAAFEVVDAAAGVVLGGLRRQGWSSMIRDEWQIFDAAGAPAGSILEDSMALALVRRFLSGLVPQSHQLLVGGQPAAQFKQRFNPFVFKADFRLEPVWGDSLDPRLALAAAVLLMAIEGRQNG